MTDQVKIILASFLISLVFADWIWCKLRVTILRQRLFAARDQLWDAAYDLGLHRDDDLLAMRERINALIRHAHHLTLPAILLLIHEAEGQTAPPVRESGNAKLQSLIDSASNEVGRAVATYVIFMRPFSGYMFATALRVLGGLVNTLRGVRATLQKARRGGMNEAVVSWSGHTTPARLDRVFTH